MRVGVGLPATIPGADAALTPAWAAAAEAGPFASLGVLDRLRYDNLDPLVALAVAAAVTQRVRLVTAILIAPLRSTAVVAKQAKSLQALSGGRLVLGVALGARQDDYEVAGVPFAGRGARFDEQLSQLRDHLEDPGVGPAAPVPEVLVGGLTGPALARMARFADGYVHNGGPPRAFARAADEARAAWADAGRPGTPRLWGQGYFALGGEQAAAAGARYLLDYYAFTGPFAQRIAEGNLTTPQQVVQFVSGYAEAGCEELLLFPTVADAEQLDRLAQALA